MAKGGARPGAGRKPGPASIEREKMKAYIAERIAENGEMIVNALLKKASKGDVLAVRELFDRGFGKATQAISNEDGVPFVLQIAQEIADKNNRNDNAPYTIAKSDS